MESRKCDLLWQYTRNGAILIPLIAAAMGLFACSIQDNTGLNLIDDDPSEIATSAGSLCSAALSSSFASSSSTARSSAGSSSAARVNPSNPMDTLSSCQMLAAALLQELYRRIDPDAPRFYSELKATTSPIDYIQHYWIESASARAPLTVWYLPITTDPYRGCVQTNPCDEIQISCLELDGPPSRLGSSVPYGSYLSPSATLTQGTHTVTLHAISRLGYRDSLQVTTEVLPRAICPVFDSSNYSPL